MRRRRFISASALTAAGLLAAGRLTLLADTPSGTVAVKGAAGVYGLFCKPEAHLRPFVRWWWNGNKVEAGELVRELRLLKAAGIGGVEINPVQFPSRSPGDDMGKPSLQWLSDEWIKMVQVVFDETKRLGMTCDMIVGSGWPFGAEYLTEEEQARIVVIGVKKLSGPLDFSISGGELFALADPPVSSPLEGRRHKLLSLTLVPDPLSSTREVTDLSEKIGEEMITIPVPGGDHALYALVEISGFMEVINGAPGASGPVLDHYNEAAVRGFLERMSGALEAGAGPLSHHLRALFTDSMELEGANWTPDMRSEFIRRRGYDIFPFLPFVLFRTGAMGNVTDYRYGAAFGPEFEEMISRMRYDFETTKAELLEERFLKTFASWCGELGVSSRMQAYGRGFFPLESSMAVDIPEGESWT
ncbi:MAG: glycosyl hydrolase, partial [Bacteroidales bacterium]|nr:glycosyl hydrolase [Bacteroidales bacterium]